MRYFLLDIQDVDDSEIFDKGTLAFVKNQLELLFANAFKNPGHNVQVNVVDDPVGPGKTRPKLEVKWEGADLTFQQVQRAAKTVVFLALVWRHGLPISPYMLEMEPESAPRPEPSG